MKQYNLEDIIDENQTAIKRESDFYETIGIPSDDIFELKKVILDDLDENSYGINWWITTTKQEKQNSILASDYLLQVIDSLQQNLLDMLLHFSEIKKLVKNLQPTYIEKDKLKKTSLGLIFNQNKTIRDFYDSKLYETHKTGCLRAIGTTLDCLAAILIGVSGLEINIFKAGFNSINSHKIKPQDNPDDEHSRYQIKQIQKFQKILEDNSPTGWASWISEVRNMLVHRGRLKNITFFTSTPSRLLSPSGNQYVYIEQSQHMCRFPDLSEIESLLQFDRSNDNKLIGEDFLIFLEKSLHTTFSIVEKSLKTYICIWKERKLENDKIKRFPIKQWPKIKSSGLEFKGFSSHHEPDNRMEISTDAGKRMKAAAIFDTDRSFWKYD